MQDKHRKTFDQASHYIWRLPGETQWTFYVTESAPATLNILVNTEHDKERIHHLLGLPGFSHEKGNHFETWRIGNGMLISLVEPAFYNEDPKKENMR